VVVVGAQTYAVADDPSVGNISSLGLTVAEIGAIAIGGAPAVVCVCALEGTILLSKGVRIIMKRHRPGTVYYPSYRMPDLKNIDSQLPKLKPNIYFNNMYNGRQ
jgi:hypothetical protein